MRQNSGMCEYFYAGQKSTKNMRLSFQATIFLLLLAGAGAQPEYDELWLRYRHKNTQENFNSIQIISTVEDHPTQLIAIEEELVAGLSAILDRKIAVVDANFPSNPQTLKINIGPDLANFILNSTNEEAFHLSPGGITANAPSGALYGAFEFLSYLQQGKQLPESYVSEVSERSERAALRKTRILCHTA